ncbi:hypothetical protein DMN91_008887, partial [Ooceraea biroi]
RQRGRPSPLLRKQTRQGAPPLAIGVGVAVALGTERGPRTWQLMLLISTRTDRGKKCHAHRQTNSLRERKSTLRDAPSGLGSRRTDAHVQVRHIRAVKLPVDMASRGIYTAFDFHYAFTAAIHGRDVHL